MLTCTVGLLSGVGTWEGISIRHPPMPRPWNPIRANIETLHEALVLIPSVMQLRERYLPQAILGLGSLWLLLAMARRGNQMGALLGGVETKTTETNQALETLAGQIRSDPVLRDLFD